MPDTPTIRSAFIPVHDVRSATAWYAEAVHLPVIRVDEWAAQLGEATTSVTLMGPASGIRASPGLPFATCSFLVSDIRQAHREAEDRGLAPSPIDGDPDVCLFYTLHDPDQNVLLFVDR